MTNRFDDIYAGNVWGHGSGEGSLVTHTSGYVRFLSAFLKQHGITSVVDAGCGDWQFSRLIDWGGATYAGFDVVESVIARNATTFAAPRVTFTHYSGDPRELPPADLLICKDVLQHLPDADVAAFVRELPKYRHCLLTNCVNPTGPTINHDIAPGEFRYLDLRLPPFGLAADQVFAFQKKESFVRRLVRGRSWYKVVLQVDRDKVRPLPR